MKQNNIPKSIFFASQIILFSGIVWSYKKSAQLYKLIIERSDMGLIERLSQIDKSFSEHIVDETTDFSWLDSIPYKHAYIISHDGLKLHGLCFNQKTDNWVIIVHGYNGDANAMLDFAKNFYERGFNVLIPDCRGHGKSEGDYIGMGWHDRLDVISWIEKINRSFPDNKIILYGISMGASTVLMASGESLPRNVMCTIEDCGYDSVMDELMHHFKRIFKMPKFPLITLTEMICDKKAGYKFSEASAIKQIERCKIPTMFIHGEKDDFVPTNMVYKLYHAAKCPKEILIVPDASHGISAKVNAKLYWERIFKFIEKHSHNEAN